MKVLSAEQIRAWDEFTMREEPIASIDLMERAAGVCVRWLESNGYVDRAFSVFCGKGNNGGNGLAIARMLAGRRYPVTVYILEFGHRGTVDFQANLARLHEFPGVDIRFIQTPNHFPAPGPGDLVIDALFGSGLNRPLEGVTALLVEHLNRSRCEIISIDIPSGLFVDRNSAGNPVLHATHTLSFQCYKPAFLVSENAEAIGKVHLLDISLHPDFLNDLAPGWELLDRNMIGAIYKPRNRFAHKGNFGHALLAAGSYGKIGAAILAARACLRTGVGLLTCHIPKCGYEMIQVAVPEAMVITDSNEAVLTELQDPSRFAALGIGPGIGTARETSEMIGRLLTSYGRPMVVDADALNCIAEEKKLLEMLPAGSILTPHPREFTRVFGETADDFDRIRRAQEEANRLNVIIILKGHHSLVATPGKQPCFNPTGNAGMATGGAGDVLTGMLTALLAQGYAPDDAAKLGVYLHGLAGDLAAAEKSEEALIASDITEKIGAAFMDVRSGNG